MHIYELIVKIKSQNKGLVKTYGQNVPNVLRKCKEMINYSQRKMTATKFFTRSRKHKDSGLSWHSTVPNFDFLEV